MKKKNDNTSAIRKFLLIYIIAMVAVGIIGVVVASVKFFVTDRTERSASVIIEFAYDGAAQNLTTSGEKLSIDEIRDTQILEKALENKGLDGKYTPEVIEKSLVITGSYPKNVIEELQSYQSLYDFSASTRLSIDNYYPTRYVIRLYDGFDDKISKADLSGLVKEIVSVYRDFFLNKYVYSFDMNAVDDILVTEDADYSRQIEIASLRIKFMEDYAAKMYKLNTSFRYGGESFNDIMVNCAALRNSLDKIKGTVVTGAVTKSLDRLKDRYRYETEVLQTEKKYKENYLAELDSLIERYQKDNVLYIASGDSILKVDSNSKTTYESLVDIKRGVSDRILEIDTLLGDYNYYLKAFTKETPASKELQASVSASLEALDASIRELETKIAGLSDAYNEQITGGDAVTVSGVSVNAPKLFSTGFIVACIKTCGPFVTVIMVLCCLHAFLYEFLRDRKARKAAEAL